MIVFQEKNDARPISLVLKKGRNRMNFIKNFKQSEVLEFKEQVIYQEGQVVSKTLAQNSNVSITLLLLIKMKKSVLILQKEMLLFM